jgi:hypothetical protein
VQSFYYIKHMGVQGKKKLRLRKPGGPGMAAKQAEETADHPEFIEQDGR